MKTQLRRTAATVQSIARTYTFVRRIKFEKLQDSIGTNPRYLSSMVDHAQNSSSSTAAVDSGLKSKLKKDIKGGLMSDQLDQALSSFEVAQERGVVLDSEDYINVLSACARHRQDKRDAAYWIYSYFVRDVVPMEVSFKVMGICVRLEDLTMALEVYSRFVDSYGLCRMSEKLLYPVMSMACKELLYKVGKDPRQQQGAFVSLFRDFEELMRNHPSTLPPEKQLFVEMARILSAAGHTDLCLQVLVRMTSARYEPPESLCDVLFEEALWSSDAKMLQVIAGWYLNNFERRLEYGCIQRMLQVAAYKGEETLARLAFKMLAFSGYSAEASHYICWARSCLAGYNDNGAIEVLVEAHAQGADLLSAPGGVSLLQEMAITMKVGTTRLDRTYFAFVDLRRNGYMVPPLALNALIIATGYLGQMDRSFGTYQEYETLFGLKPDVHTHNSLLISIAHSKRPSVKRLLVVFEDMEAQGIEPNELSYSTLLECMAETGEMRYYDDIIAHVTTSNTLPSRHALRRVIIRLAMDGKTSRLDKALELLRELSDGDDPPLFLTRRLQQISKNTAANEDLDHKDEL